MRRFEPEILIVTLFIENFKKQFYIMVADLFVELRKEIVPSSDRVIILKKLRSNKPKRNILLLLVLICGLIIFYVSDNFTNTDKVVLSDSEKLNELIDKVLKDVPLLDSEWNELCRLLSKERGIEINACDECRNYTKALLGGRHENWLHKYQDVPDKSILKGINKLERQIFEHLDKIKNPSAYYPEWDKLDPRRKSHLVDYKWKKDIERQREQKEILECILKNR